ncbi:hypothetical protein D3C71_1560970 [compost metagenome]
MALGAAQPLRKRLGVVPGHVDNGVVVSLRKAGVAPRIARIAPLERIAPPRGGWVVVGVVAIAACAVSFGLRLMARGLQKPPELAHCYLVLTQIERAANAHLVCWSLVGQFGEAFGFQRRVGAGQRVGRLHSAHPEISRGHSHKRHAEAVGPHRWRSRHLGRRCMRARGHQ